MKFFLLILVIFKMSTLSYAAEANKEKTPTFYTFSYKTIEGKYFSFSDLKDKVVLVVNTASHCGFTPQLKDLESLYQKYKNKGFLVIAIPSNDFKQEEPEASGILTTARTNYKTTFPILEKQIITGEKKSELYKYLTERKSNLVFKEVQWNFEKFLVNKNGEVVERWSSMTSPSSDSIVRMIEKSL